MISLMKCLIHITKQNNFATIAFLWYLLNMPIDWTKICKKYKGLWVGLKADEKTVVTSGKTVKEVMEKSQKKGYFQPILFRVPTKIVPYIGGFML